MQLMHARSALALLLPLFAACGGGGGTATPVPAPEPPAAAAPSPAPAPPPAPAPAVSTSPGSAFFYQDVAPRGNSVRAGFTADGRNITSYNYDLMTWQVLNGNKQVYADAVISRLSNGRWVMLAGTGFDDPRGKQALMLHESACPRVDDAAVRVLNRSSAPGCVAAGFTAMAKPSQVIEVDGSLYTFNMADSKIMLIRLSDSSKSLAGLQSICVRSTPAASAASLAPGEATFVIDSGLAPGLLLSDTAVARRTDGTWVLFYKGIAASVGCSGGALCELCARAIYRSTSTNLIAWTAPERMVSPASVPDASLMADGKVWLYWQDFGPACTAQNLDLAARAPIRGAPESEIAASAPIRIAGEAFETNTGLHYPTNGNPVLLPDAAAKTAFEACLR